MSGIDVELRPVDYIVVEWPEGSPPNGQTFSHVVDLVDRGIIRFLDLAFYRRTRTGT